MITQRKTFFLGLLASALFFVAYFPALQILATKWANSDEYSHAFLTIPIIFYMVWSKRKRLLEVSSDNTFLGLLLIIFSIALYFFTLLTQVHTIIALSMFMTIVGIAVYLLGIKAIKDIFTPLLLLLMLIPIPDQLYTQLTFPLQVKVSQFAEMIVRFLGVAIFREGNVMNIPDRSFEVVEACSGLRSVVTLLTLSVIMGYFMLKNVTAKLALVVASVPVAIFVNIIRVVSMILVYHFFKLDLAIGLWHTVTGLVIFLLALLILYLLLRVLELWELKEK